MKLFFKQPDRDTLRCSGDVLPIVFDVVDSYQAGNVYTIQLSDTGGNFATPLTLTTIMGQLGGQYNWTVPATVKYGKHYLIRIIASAPADTVISDFFIELQPQSPASVSISSNPSSGIWKGLKVTFTALPVNGGSNPTYQWKLNGTNVAGANSNIWSTTTLNNGDKVSCAMHSDMQCATVKDTISNILTMNISEGIDSVINGKLNVYPNPTHHELIVEGLARNGQIQLVDMLGRVLIKQTTTSKTATVNTQSLVPGNYILRLKDDYQIATFRIAKE